MNPQRAPRLPSPLRRQHKHHTTMICRNCIQRATALGRRSTIQNAPFRRAFSTTIAPRQAAAAAAAPASSSDATSEEQSARSTCSPGTVLNGLNYFKGKTDPVALPDAEYPEWLWSCLDVLKKSGGDEDSGAGDEFCTLAISLYTPSDHNSWPPFFLVFLTLVVPSHHSQIQETATDSRQATAHPREPAPGSRRPRGAGAQNPTAAPVY